jgi:hypothetical protein
MEIKTLVIIGFILILCSSCLYFYINMDALLDYIKYLKLNTNFKVEKTSELKTIDNRISNELEKRDADVVRLQQELEALKRSMAEKKTCETKPAETKPVENKEVFLVSNNIFSKSDGATVCKGLFNSSAATKEQLNDSFNNGANWCNYGWTSEGEAYYPLQNDTLNSTCEGKAGLNGGIMEDNNYKLGILCYGVKPEEKKYTNLDIVKRDCSMAEADLKLLENYRKKLENGNVKITPFNDKAWSRYSYKNDTLAINDKIVVSTKKECSNDPQTLDTNKSRLQAII